MSEDALIERLPGHYVTCGCLDCNDFAVHHLASTGIGTIRPQKKQTYVKGLNITLDIKF